MAAAHTRGPWVLKPLEDGVEYLRIRGTQLGYRYKVCNVHAPFQHNAAEVLESQANARLIVAAPELLDALQDLIANVTEAMRTGGWVPTPLHKSFWLAMSDASAAVSKATGEAL